MSSCSPEELLIAIESGDTEIEQLVIDSIQLTITHTRKRK